MSLLHKCAQLMRTPGLSLHIPLFYGMLQLGKLCFNSGGIVGASFFMTVMAQMTAVLLHIC